jgi:hypothetical protein
MGEQLISCWPPAFITTDFSTEPIAAERSLCPELVVPEAVLVTVVVAEAGADPVEAELWSVGASVPMPAALLLVELELATQSSATQSGVATSLTPSQGHAFAVAALFLGASTLL